MVGRFTLPDRRNRDHAVDPRRPAALLVYRLFQAVHSRSECFRPSGQRRQFLIAELAFKTNPDHARVLPPNDGSAADHSAIDQDGRADRHFNRTIESRPSFGNIEKLDVMSRSVDL